jgi:hypothetical protein
MQAPEAKIAVTHESEWWDLWEDVSSAIGVVNEHSSL